MRAVLIPKAVREQPRWQRALAGEAVTPLWVDPWQIDRLPLTPEARNHWLNLDLFTGVICVSPTAAQVLVEALDTYWPMPPAQVHWLCNGPRTAEVLADAGLSVIYPEHGHTAEDVLAQPEAQCRSGDKWLIVKGDGGRVTLQNTLTQRGAVATELAVYRRSVNTAALDEMAGLTSRADALWLSSEFLGQQLLSDEPDIWLNWPGEWWVSSPRLESWAEQQGIQRIRVAPGATVKALQTLIRESAST